MSVVRYLEKDRCLVSEGGSYPRICLGYNIFELRIMHDKERCKSRGLFTLCDLVVGVAWPLVSRRCYLSNGHASVDIRAAHMSPLSMSKLEPGKAFRCLKL